MATVGVIEAVLRMDARQFDRTVDRAIGKTKELLTSPRALAAAAGVALAGVSKLFGDFAVELANAGQGVEALTSRLDAAFDGDGLTRITEAVRELGSTGEFNTSQFDKLSRKLAAFEDDVQAVEDDLTRVGNIASKTGGSFESLGESFATFGVKSEATTRLLELANISPQRLAQFGAVLDETGKGLDLTGDNAQKAKDALRALADADFAGAMDATVTSTEALRAELQLLKEDSGAGLASLTEGAAEYLLPFVEGLRELPGPAKAAIGLTTGLVSAVAGLTAATIALGLAAGPIAAGFSAGAAILGGAFAKALLAAQLQAFALSTTVGSLAAGLGVLAAAAVAIPGLFIATTNAIKDQTKAEEELLQIELRRAANQRELASLLGKSTAELQDAGKTAKDVVGGIEALQERIEIAQRAGNTDLVNRLKARVVELQAAKRELAAAENAEREEVAEAAAYNSPEAKAAREKAAKEVEAQRKEQLDAELGAIDLRLAKEEISQAKALELRKQALDKFKADEQTKRQLAIETAKFEQAQQKKATEDSKDSAEAARVKKFQDELYRIELLSIQRKIGAKEELALLQNVLDKFDLTEQEKRGLVRQTAQLQAQLAQETTDKKKQELDKQKKDAEDAAKKEEADAKKAASDIAREQSEAAGLRTSELDRQIESLQKETEDTGVNNTGKIRARLQEQLRIQTEQIRAEAEREKAATESAEARALIEENTQARIRAEIAETAQAEQDAVESQVEAIERLKAARREDERSFGDDPYGIEQLSEKLKEEQSTTRRGSRLPRIEAQFSQASSLQFTPIQPAVDTGGVVAQRQEPAKVEGSIEFTIAIDSDGKAAVKDVATTDIDGRFSEISSNLSGMRGRLSFG